MCVDGDIAVCTGVSVSQGSRLLLFRSEGWKGGEEEREEKTRRRSE